MGMVLVPGPQNNISGGSVFDTLFHVPVPINLGVQAGGVVQRLVSDPIVLWLLRGTGAGTPHHIVLEVRGRVQRLPPAQ